MAICVIGFDAYFLNHPMQCFLSDDCSLYKDYFTGFWDDLWNVNELYDIKVPVIRAQLAAGVLMLTSCIIYIIIFSITTYRILKTARAIVPAMVFRPSIAYNSPPNMMGDVRNYGYDRRASLASRSLVLPPNNPVKLSTNTTIQENPMICPYCQSTLPLATEY